MKLCEYEEEVVMAIAQGLWTDELRLHVAHCESCQWSERISPFMKTLLEKTEAKIVLPNYRWILFKAELEQERTEKRRFRRFLSVGSFCAIVASAVAATIVLTTAGFTFHLPDGAPDASIIAVFIGLLILADTQLSLLLKPITKREIL